MNDREAAFLERMCSKIKYKTMHKEICEELKDHIEETAFEYENFSRSHDMAVNMALSKMGNATEIGEELNNYYHMPFDCRFGLAIWSGIVTFIIYIAYPLIYKIHNWTINLQGHGSAVILILLTIFVFANFSYLRRGQLKISFRDAIHITAGFLIGWAAVMILLLATSAIAEYGYYLYFPDVEIPFAPLYAPLLPKNQQVFGVEYFCWWVCLIVYMAAAKSRKKIKPFTLVAGWFRLSNGKPMEDASVLADGIDTDGRKIRLVELAIMGLRRDKYGEKQKGMNYDNY